MGTKLVKIYSEQVPSTKQRNNENVDSSDPLLEREDEESIEDCEEPSIAKYAIWKYLRAGASPLHLTGLGLLWVVIEICGLFTMYWIRFWTQQEGLKLQKSMTYINSSSSVLNVTSNFSGLDANVTYGTEFLSPKTGLIVLGSLLLLSYILLLIQHLWFYRICINASRNLHKRMFSTILKAPMHFFDENPSGHILNRFSKDMGIVDEYLPCNLRSTLGVFTFSMRTMIQIIFVKYWMIIPSYILLHCFWKLKNIYMKTAPSLWRLEATGIIHLFSGAI